MRRPTDSECQKIVAQWKSGTSVGALRVYQVIVVTMVAVMGSVALSGGLGLSAAMLLLIGFLLLMLWLVVMWGKFIKSIRSRTAQLESGNFSIDLAEGQKPGTLSTYNFYVGFANAKLPDGAVINGLQMPYKPALKMRRKRVKSFPAYLVQIAGEDKPMIFLHEN